MKALPRPVAVKYPDTGLRDDRHALALWRLHGYDTGGEPLYSAEQMVAYAEAHNAYLAGPFANAAEPRYTITAKGREILDGR